MTDEPLRISMGAPGPRKPTRIPKVDDPIIEKADPMLDGSGAPSRARPHSVWDEDAGDGREIESQAILGYFDAWVGEVLQVNYAAGDTVFGESHWISVQRVTPEYGTNNEPTLIEAPGVFSQPTPAVVQARPFPLRHDQEKYLCVAGDSVMVLSGRDGRHYYMIDDLPFIAWVIDTTVGSTGEDAAGGAGLICLNVRRFSLTGDPGAGGYTAAGVQLTNLLTAASAVIDYDGVRVIAPTGVQHGYRVGDPVVVTKRGRYLFAEPVASSFLAAVFGTGPSGQADFATNYYWLKEQNAALTFSDTAAYTLAPTARTRAVAGMTGTSGRWVCAKNLAEDDDEHELEVGDLVVVAMFADPATKKPYYVFCRSLPAGVGGSRGIRLGHPTTAYTNASTFILDPCDAAGTDNGLVNVTVEAGFTLPAGTTIPTTAIVPFAKAANNNHYVLGQMKEVMTNIEYNTTYFKLRKKVRGCWGWFSTTESDWVDVTTAVDCTAV